MTLLQGSMVCLPSSHKSFWLTAPFAFSSLSNTALLNFVIMSIPFVLPLSDWCQGSALFIKLCCIARNTFSDICDCLGLTSDRTLEDADRGQAMIDILIVRALRPISGQKWLW